MYQKNYHIHFVGIGGIGMSGIAELLLGLGYLVSGSDVKPSNITRRLQTMGATVYTGHKAEQIREANVIVTSTAISQNNPEVTAAREQGIPIIPRAEMLAELMRIKYAIAISGAHGKTSTTSMVAHILNRAGLDPTVVIGGLLKHLNTNALQGKGDYIVAEADESDGSFLKYTPAIAAVTNIDLEHLDFYTDIEDIKAKFQQFINSVPFYGLAVLCLDNEHIQDMLPDIKVRYTTFGLTAQADLKATDIEFKGIRSLFRVVHKDISLGRIQLNLSGRHNISNALAAIAIALELNIDFSTIKMALEDIDGVKRRLEIKGDINDILVMDDYGHHPHGNQGHIEGHPGKPPHRRLVVIFQPHRYSRTKALFDAFTRAFYQSDILIVLPIYPASEAPIEGVDSQTLCRGIKAHGHKEVHYAQSVDHCLSMLMETVKPNDLILTLGAGDVYRLGENFIGKLEEQ